MATAESAPALQPNLSFEQTVPRSLVHRSAINEVFLTDSAVIGKRQWAIAAMLPRSHMLFNDGGNPGYLDPIAVMEVTRQVTEYVAHVYAHVPDDNFLVFRDMQVEFTDPGALRTGPEPARLLVVVNARTSERMRERPVTISVDGRECGRAGGRWLPLPLHYYQAARERARAKKLAVEPVPSGSTWPTRLLEPERAGRRLSANILLGDPSVPGPDAAAFTLALDQSHPVFFDHAVDHVPGMLMLEAARQGALAVLAEHRGTRPDRALIVACDVDFGNFCELDLHTRCHAAITGSREGDGAVRHAVRVTFEQARETFGTVTLEVIDESGSH
ncbi:hypothetical protein NDR87_14910 [Nocardia sp. CDC159]|uniref:A-factor biosynthesis hotdog domain-containing protein n=1 Tax=Nocardia pulmonis TaxID=2951408 RepID=A0A9X2EA15_9NOCA|nr:MULTISPECIES: AfsA-related hotdog domain-containing protein [Nocardia]MCM6775620.1 hypothetical protein [Nocardia pulmonis]MCM6787646.1 hypothetical protein [Nocardia sp. CDC159]